jgi:predicted outer membrane repeat protein
MKRIFSLACFFILGCFMSQMFADQVFYVAQNGNDAQDGTSQATAFKTLAKAVSVVEYATPTTIYLEEDAVFNSPATVTLGEGRELTIVGKNTTVKSGDNPYFGQRILTLGVSTDVKITGVTFRNACTRSGIPGGAIFFEGTRLEIDSCTFIENEANNSGGAVASRGKDLIITNSVFHKNRAQSGYGYGGVIYHCGLYGSPIPEPGSLIIRNCSFTENSAHSDTHGDVISFGHAYRDSGIPNGYTNVTYFELVNCLFKDNINVGVKSNLRPGPAEIYFTDTRDDMAVNIINNTFYKSQALAVPFYFDRPFRLVNNVFYNKDSYVITCSNESDERDPFIAWNNVVVGEMIKVDDPSFNAQKEAYGNQIFANYADIKLATVAKKDDSQVYYLPINDATSVLVNSGLSSTAGKDGFDKEYIPATDMRGVAVRGAKDIGAFELITETGISSIGAENLFTIGRSGDNAIVKNNTGKALDLQIRLLDGRTIYRAQVANELTLSKSDLEVPGGVLIFTVSNGKTSDSRKVILF